MATSTTSSVQTSNNPRVTEVLNDKQISSFIHRHGGAAKRIQDAVDWIVRDSPELPKDDVVKTVVTLFRPLVREKLSVFFSYKATDMPIAREIADRLKEWSGNRLIVHHMADLGIKHVGKDWRERLEKQIPACDWFLLLLPDPSGRDWPLFEAGYFRGHQSVVSRLVCLHHFDNEIADALGENQSVPATKEAVLGFLKGLLCEPNWIPGMPALNPAVRNLPEKAQELANLIQAPSVKECCGPFLDVEIDDSASIDGWSDLQKSLVSDCNERCKQLFHIVVSPPSLGDWLQKVNGDPADWAEQLTQAVRIAVAGGIPPRIEATVTLGNGQVVRPTICSVTRGAGNGRLQRLRIVFAEARTGAETGGMSPGIAALATNLQFAVDFRYKILAKFAYRRLTKKDVQAFHHALVALERNAVHDPRLADINQFRQLTVQAFEGDDRSKIGAAFKRWDELHNLDGDGEMDQAIQQLNASALMRIVKELLEINQQFLTLTSARLAGGLAA